MKGNVSDNQRTVQDRPTRDRKPFLNLFVKMKPWKQTLLAVSSKPPVALSKPLGNAKTCKPEQSALLLQVVEKIPAVTRNQSEVS